MDARLRALPAGTDSPLGQQVSPHKAKAFPRAVYGYFLQNQQQFKSLMMNEQGEGARDTRLKGHKLQFFTKKVWI